LQIPPHPASPPSIGRSARFDKRGGWFEKDEIRFAMRPACLNNRNVSLDNRSFRLDLGKFGLDIPKIGIDNRKLGIDNANFRFDIGERCFDNENPSRSKPTFP
jgi:hypothetical protein